MLGRSHNRDMPMPAGFWQAGRMNKLGMGGSPKALIVPVSRFQIGWSG